MSLNNTESTIETNANENATIEEETLPPIDGPIISECRKPLKKRRVLIHDLSESDSKEQNPQPIELVRQVATYWEHDCSSTTTNEQEASNNAVPSTIISKPKPYNYDDYYYPEKAQNDCQLTRANFKDSSTFRSLALSSCRRPMSSFKATDSVFNPITTIIELKKPPQRLDDDEDEKDLEEELNSMTLCSDSQTLPSQQDRQMNTVTPSPTHFRDTLLETKSKKQNSGRSTPLFTKHSNYQSADFDPIPWSCEHSITGMAESSLDFLLAMDLERSYLNVCKSKDEEKNFSKGTPSNSPMKPDKRVRFDPAANTVITITPRKVKGSIVVPTQTSHGIQERQKSRIEVVMENYPLLSPIKSIRMGQSSSAFSRQDRHPLR